MADHGAGWVEGALIEVRASRLAALDRYEGKAYRRVRIAVRTAAGRRLAWVYISAENASVPFI